MKNPAAGGGHWVDVAPGRLAGWIEGFAARHGGIVSVRGARSARGGTALVTFVAADGSLAECHPPFPPLSSVSPVSPVSTADAEAIAAHALRARIVGVLLVRLGGYAVGVFSGSPPVLRASKTGSRPVHGRSAAGGWSQHRFARRREKQVSEALGAAADAAVKILSEAAPLDAVVLGGDRRAIDALRDDTRLAPYLARAEERFLTVPDPKLSVLRDTPRIWSAIRIRVVEPPHQPTSSS